MPFLLYFTLYLRTIFQVQAPGGLTLEGRFNGGFLALQDWGAYIFRGLFSEFYGICLPIAGSTSIITPNLFLASLRELAG